MMTCMKVVVVGYGTFIAEISPEKFLVLFLSAGAKLAGGCGEVMTSYVVVAPALRLQFNGHQLINCFCQNYRS